MNWSAGSTPVLVAEVRMFMLAEYVNMTTVSALAYSTFLGGWQAVADVHARRHQQRLAFPLVWFTTRRSGDSCSCSSGCEQPYPGCADQFMALGWKLLIPTSLLWMLVVATLAHLRRADQSPTGRRGSVAVHSLVTESSPGVPRERRRAGSVSRRRTPGWNATSPPPRTTPMSDSIPSPDSRSPSVRCSRNR